MGILKLYKFKVFSAGENLIYMLSLLVFAISFLSCLYKSEVYLHDVLIIRESF